MSKTINPLKLVSPKPYDEGFTLKQAIALRHSSREFSPQPLSLRHLSELMWAMYGVNRPKDNPHPGRTVPSAMAFYPLSIYVMTEAAVYLYEPIEHKLLPVAEGDHRSTDGTQSFVAQAPVDIAIFANAAMMHGSDCELNNTIRDNIIRMASLDAGAVAQNAYLYCAANSINIVERMAVDVHKLTRLLNVSDESQFIVALSIGYPPEES